MKIYTLLYYFQLFCFFISFVFSIRTIGNKNVPGYMKWFFVYSFVAFGGLSIVAVIHHFRPEDILIKIIITITSVIFHYFFFSFYFNGIFIQKVIRRVFLIVLLFSIPVVLLLVKKNISDLSGLESFTVVNFCLIFFCILYYYQLFTSSPKKMILTEPSFWVVSGIFFSMGITIPIHSIFKYLKSILSIEIFDGLRSIGFFAYGIMHLFFTKAYICSLAPKKVL